MSAGLPVPGAEPARGGLSGSIADGKANDGRTALREDLAGTLSARFHPQHADPDYRAEMERIRMPVPDATRDAAMVTFRASDGCLSSRALTFGEIADALLDASWRRVVEDDDTVERVAAAVADADKTSWEDIQSGLRHGSKWAPNAAEYYRSLARAVVRALREDTTHG